MGFGGGGVGPDLPDCQITVLEPSKITKLPANVKLKMNQKEINQQANQDKKNASGSVHHTIGLAHQSVRGAASTTGLGLPHDAARTAVEYLRVKK